LAAAPTEIEIKQAERAAIDRFARLRRTIGRRLLEPGSVLEIGCGIGSFLPLLGALGWGVRGIEPDSRYAEVGRELYGIDIDTVLFGAGFAEQDLIASFCALQYEDSPKEFLTQVHEALKPDGLFFLEVPSFDRPVVGNLDGVFATRHKSIYYREFLERELPRLGFSLVKSGHTRHNYWAVLKKAVPVLPFVKPRTARPAIWKTRIVRRVFGNAGVRAPAALSWAGTYALATGGMTDGDFDHARIQIDRLARKHVANGLSRLARRKPLVHIGIQSAGNAGDVVLSDVVRQAVGASVRRPWMRKSVYDAVTPAEVERLNRSSAGIVIGGGGLFLADSNANALSGWQWPIAAKTLRGFRVPLAVFAVGYNKFRGQDRLADGFGESLAALAEKCFFVGIRNRGSIRELKTYLPESLQSKLVYQPCPTTILADLPLGMRALSRRPASLGRRLALNVAFDRFGRRYGTRLRDFVDAVVNIAQMAQHDGWQIDIACHTAEDAAICPYLDRAGVRYAVSDLCYRSTVEVVAFYAAVDLAIGVRGHAQMIPFGLGVPIISLVTHDKMAWFLEDVGHADWGVDMSGDEAGRDLAAAYSAAISNLAVRRLEVAEARRRLERCTADNLAVIASGFR
jgi:SAM-dependent methyltransferase/polysaccharide pyruvyl transferase WcaK-like protein